MITSTPVLIAAVFVGLHPLFMCKRSDLCNDLKWRDSSVVTYGW